MQSGRAPIQGISATSLQNPSAIAQQQLGLAIDVKRDYGASGSSASTTGTISAGSTTLTLASAIDFANGQGIAVMHAGPGPYQVGTTTALAEPTSVTATPTGTAGTTAYKYWVAALDDLGGVTAFVAGTTATGNATLSTTNYNAISWPAVTGAWAYAILGDASNPTLSQGFLAVASGATYNDQGNGNSANGGNAYVQAPPWVPTTPTTTALGEYLLTTIVSGAGTTSLTLAASATSAISGEYVAHDDTPATNAALVAASNGGGNGFVVSLCQLQIWGQVIVPNNTALIGETSMPDLAVETGTAPAFSPHVVALIIRGTALPAITFAQTRASGARISGFALYWPDQVDTNPPIPYPAGIALPSSTEGAYDFSCENLYPVNAYDFINAQVSHGRLHVRNVVGWAMHRGIIDDGSVDTDRIENIHFIPVWPNFAPSTAPSHVYALNNAIHYVFGRVDALQAVDLFSFGAAEAYRFFKGSVTGVNGTTWGQLTNIFADGWSAQGVHVIDYNPVGLTLCNVHVTSDSSGLYGVLIDANCDEPSGIVQILGLATGNSNYGIGHGGNTGLEVYSCAIQYNTAGIAINPNSGSTSKLRIFGGKFGPYGSSSAGNDFVNFAASGATVEIVAERVEYTNASSIPALGGTFPPGSLAVNPISPAGVQTAPAVPAASTALQNPFPYTVQVVVTGGAAVDIGIGNTSTTTATGLAAGSVTLAAGQYVSLGAYTTAPTWTWIGS